jgi:hypothetical protein
MPRAPPVESVIFRSSGEEGDRTAAGGTDVERGREGRLWEIHEQYVHSVSQSIDVSRLTIDNHTEELLQEHKD